MLEQLRRGIASSAVEVFLRSPLPTGGLGPGSDELESVRVASVRLTGRWVPSGSMMNEQLAERIPMEI